MEAAQRAAEASLAEPVSGNSTEPEQRSESGFERGRVAEYLRLSGAAVVAAAPPPPADTIALEVSGRLSALAQEMHDAPLTPNLEELDRTLSVLEERLVAALLTATPEAVLADLREQAARELAPYRGKMQAVQIRQIQQQFLHKRLLEAHSLPRLSLFYMSLA